MRNAIACLVSIVIGFFAVSAWAGVDIGPSVGAKIPDGFTALDQTGAKTDFGAIAGEKGLVLAFVRSAGWCPYCQKQLMDLQTIAGDLSKRGYNLAALSYDAPTVLAEFAKKRMITYTLLSDQKSAMIDAFDLRDPQYKEGSTAYGVPRPAIFIVDRGGVIRGKLAEDGYKTRPATDEILKMVESLDNR